MNDLSDMVAIVTGASSGIGESIARQLAAEGVRVALAARREKELERVAAAIHAEGGTALVVPTDVCEEPELAELVERTEAELGPVDILVNNAGIGGSEQIHQMSMKKWDRVMDVNLRAPVFLSKLVLRGMRERRRGFVVNIASEAGVYVYAGTGAYTVSKHGLRVVTELIQQENQGHGIKAWAICPGMVETEMTADSPGTNPRNFLRAEEVAETVLFLLKQGDNVKMGPEILIRTMRDPRGK